ncbi:T9SS type B sorting domain-containing protein [Arenibacter sp. GZD96]|uniref:T9SS type B sorting domain-containing protein n=1 Tax=Aurantibrevibacter litoralis TaxID=3106030 RepID=UPI002AFFDBA2|nr:T9SS type B sorting domain-containing protein [Arenibacter sp. GZD-96]MEA1787107.1 T9SS type B sorting domain-containing protein [Arenibacter sp. GZD-96]
MKHAYTLTQGTATKQECSHTINAVDDFFACDRDGNSFEEFRINLDSLESVLIGNQSGLTITYHDPGGTLIDFSIGNQNVVNRRGILARATDSNGCIRETLFNLFALPPPTVPVFSDVTVCDTYVLPELPGRASYFTNPMGLGALLPSGTFIRSNQQIFIYSANGNCASESTLRVRIDTSLCQEQPPPEEIEKVVLEFPKFFTPNGDGINDFWQFRPQNYTPESSLLNILIYNRFGMLIKELDPTSQGWDGTFNGRPMPASDYWFRAVDRQNVAHIGHFTLKR